MKAILFFIVLILCACSTPIRETCASSRITLTHIYDFREYTSKGFLITPYSFNGSYESLGLLTVFIYPAKIEKIIKDEKPKIVSYDDSNPFKTEIKYCEDEVLSADFYIKSIYNEAVKLGADAIVDFKVIHGNPNIVEGFAIKRK